LNNFICRCCLAPLPGPFLSLGNQPLSNAYLKLEQLRNMEPTYPLDVYHCPQCHLVQVTEFEKASDIFNEEYAYFSSFSTSWLKHCSNYADMIVNRLNLNNKSFVMEIASNDGYLLQYFKVKNILVLGVEPAAGTAKVAQEKGIPTDICFFDIPYAKKLVATGKQADLIAGNNVLAHNPNLREFVQALKITLKPEGVITLEFPHLLRMMQGNQFDTIYHEHYSYLGLLSLVPLFKEFGLVIFDVDELPTHGGSLRIFATHLRDGVTIRKSVSTVLEAERAYGLDREEIYNSFRMLVEKVKRDLLSKLIEYKEQGKQIVAYGAAAKGNTLLNYCGIRTDFIEFVVDKNTHKQGKFLPGTLIEIKAPSAIEELKPDVILILPWNIKDEVMEQMANVKKFGARFIVPIPSVKEY